MMWYFMLAVAIYISVYTISYGVWEWKRENKAGAVAVTILCVIALTVPVIRIFI